MRVAAEAEAHVELLVLAVLVVEETERLGLLLELLEQQTQEEVVAVVLVEAFKMAQVVRVLLSLRIFLLHNVLPAALCLHTDQAQA